MSISYLVVGFKTFLKDAIEYLMYSIIKRGAYFKVGNFISFDTFLMPIKWLGLIYPKN